jgi:hypothetical protein
MTPLSSFGLIIQYNEKSRMMPVNKKMIYRKQDYGKGR